MKLPKCPHCDKLMVSVISDVYSQRGLEVNRSQEAAYLCPEKLDRKEPDWVEVLEV